MRLSRWLVLLASTVILIAGLIQFGGGSVLGWFSRPLSSAGQLVTERFNPSSAADDAAEVKQLRAQLLAVSQRLTETQRQLEVTGSLGDLEEFLQDQPIQAIAALVIGYSPDLSIQSIVIQRGSRHGVEPGLAVITEQGIVIGIVTRADPTTSTVRLLIDTQSRLLTKVQNDAQSRGILIGERGLAVAMQFIPRNDVVTVGQTVVTSGLDPNIPPDLLIGTVQETTARAGELFQTAVVQTPIEFQRLNVVAVVRPRL
jgi:rod shape-determining protein MreC